MDQHPKDPRHPVSPAPRGNVARRRLTAVLALIAVTAATTGTAVYLNRDSPTWQRILGTEPVIEVVPEATDELPVLLEALDEMLMHPASSTNAKTTTALGEVRALLAEHVELLTPGALEARAAAAEQAAAEGSEAPPAAVPSMDPAEFAPRLALAGNGLLNQALTAPEQEARRLAGAGIELGLAARTLLSATGAQQAEIDTLPTPATVPGTGTGNASATPAPTGTGPEDAGNSPASGPTTDRAAQQDMPDFTFASCPLPVSGTTETGPETSQADTSGNISADSGRLLGQVIDASYRLGYAYDVAGARTSAGLRSTARDRSGILVDFATSIERQLDTALDCAPLRQPAYQLPTDAVANPMDAARSGEGQLALLLRDAAAGQSSEARAYLFNAAWAQALLTRQVTGDTPDFTAVDAGPALTDENAPAGTPPAG